MPTKLDLARTLQKITSRLEKVMPTDTPLTISEAIADVDELLLAATDMTYLLQGADFSNAGEPEDLDKYNTIHRTLLIACAPQLAEYLLEHDEEMFND